MTHLPANTAQVVEARHRLKLLTPFLEHLIGEGTTDPNVHNALGECGAFFTNSFIKLARVETTLVG